MTAPHEVGFTSGSDRLAAWHFPAAHDDLAGPGGRPVVVMAHGFAGTKDSGLSAFAEPLARAGCDVLAFDYRGFGASQGQPRQTVTVADQVDDYRAAMGAAARLPGVDPARLVLWGVSLSGGHVLAAAAGRDDVAAVISLTPLVDGWAAGAQALATHDKRELVRSTVSGVRSRFGRPRVVPVVARPGEPGCLTLDGSLEGYLAIAGPTWVNEVDAAVGLELGGYRPIKDAGRVRCRVLVQIADHDRSAPPQAAAKAAVAARAVVRHYPCDHFDVWAHGAWHDSAVRHQVMFLEQVLSPQPAAR